MDGDMSRGGAEGDGPPKPSAGDGGAAAVGDTAAVIALVGETGRTLNRASYPVSYSRVMMDQIARAYGVEAEYAVLPNLIMGVSKGDHRVAMLGPAGSFRFDQVVASQNEILLARRAAVPAADALASLQRLERIPAPYPSWLRILGYVLMGIGVAGLFRMSIPAIVGAAVLGALAGVALVAAGDRPNIAALMPVLMTFCAALGVAWVSGLTGFDDPVRLAVVPAIALIPGAGLTASLIELARGDMVSGSSRLIYSLTIVFSMAFGFAVAISLVDLPTSQLQGTGAAPTPAWVAWAGALVFVVGAAIYFCTPRSVLAASIIVPLIAFAVDQAVALAIPATLAAGVATAVALLLARIINGRAGGGPAVAVIFIPAFWLLVPTTLVFVSFTGLITDDRSLTSLGHDAIMTLLSMAVGILIVGLLPPLTRRMREALASDDAGIEGR